ncbi:MAG TPA: T9SS type A sorting domain-containing protein [Flavobacteriales bacterium]|nr:T9SS type A sorting domain-containing protein [Flavobacteriales bacterium]HMR26235.1 T9SS type A sorting domain-containing protein [Flavobacteriales bacterium]
MTKNAMIAGLLLLAPQGMKAQDVAELNPGERRTEQHRDAIRSTGEDPITDDGHDTDRLSPAAQFVITSEPDAKGTLHVQIRDESGRVVQDRSYADRTTIAVDLGHLQHGRYAARVERGGQVVVRRFVRP